MKTSFIKNYTYRKTFFSSNVAFTIERGNRKILNCIFDEMI